MLDITHRRRRLSKKSSLLSLPRFLSKLSCVPSIGSIHSSSSSVDEKHAFSESDENMSSSTLHVSLHGEEAMYLQFIAAYPEYMSTWLMDSLRRSDYTRLSNTGEAYLDYMGGSMYPESLVRVHSAMLTKSVMGNTHSVSNSSSLSSAYSAEARAAVLKFFDAGPDYVVIFTPNASGAMKLVGEAYPFAAGGAFFLGVDSHNSINGIRVFANQGGAEVHYLRSGNRGGLDIAEAKAALKEKKPKKSGPKSLFAMTGMSNISNVKNPLSLIEYASQLGYHTLLDAAALAPTTPISLRDTPADAMAVSFYKMFGYPTGVGALIAKKSFLEELRRPWFAGGNVDVVQVPGSLVTLTHDLQEQFEDGTINYLTLPAISEGLRFLSVYMPHLTVRLACLHQFLTRQLEELRHDRTKTPVVKILSRVSSGPVSKLSQETGYTISMIFLESDGQMMPNSFIEYAATRSKISLRTGCVCNPGGAAVLLGIEDHMALLEPGVTLNDFQTRVGRELGVVRISLGLASSFDDIRRFLEFAASVANQSSRLAQWEDWKNSKAHH